ncbi:unnamed protein product [Callosobruchus maculatus]|uniref:Uncharacterized protein n=2 Tax=Callosobruchus maculatus TaxID=64391 RepID=A0A653CCH5_CALMS|nr:unnamed protein product [Callosobruchus maculatus]
MGLLKDKCVVLVTHNQECLSHVSGIYVINNGNVEGRRAYKQLFDLEGNLPKDIMNSYGITVEGKETFEEKAILGNRNQSRKKDEIIHQGSIRSMSYKEYAKAGGGYIVSVVLVGSLFLTAHVTGAFNDYFLRFWVNMEQSKRTSGIGNHFSEVLELLGDFHETRNCLHFYSGIVISLVAFALVRSLAFMTVCMRASQNLHKNLYLGVVGTTMKFFNMTSQGTIINRFSSDIKSVDRDLPTQFLDTLHAAFTVFFISLLVTTVNPWMMILTVVTLVIFYRIKQYCLKTIRNIKRIEDSRRSPVFAHLNATMNGITTIRAFGVQKQLREHFDELQDRHTGPADIGITGKRAFGFWLEMFVIFYVALVLISFRLFLEEKYGGNVGFAVTQAISLTGIFQFGMRQWGELETRMTSVERILEYSQQEPEEKKGKSTSPSTKWPSHGEIVFNKVSVRYLKEEDLVLENLSFQIKEKEKIGIVGRTGAGKSSILATLLRLVSAERGTIKIDGVDINDLPLPVLRSKISVIPQEPVLFSGTIRKNLDPFDEYSDTDLWSALENVKLNQFFWERPGGLQSTVAEGGADLSVGQRQLICLARAIIRKNKILVLDEATANVDHVTDSEIQKAIAKNFKEYTVLTIAHRVETVIDSDRILVLDKGHVEEFDHPYKLLQNENGLFYRLASEAKSIFDNLLHIARQNYEYRPNQ